MRTTSILSAALVAAALGLTGCSDGATAESDDGSVTVGALDYAFDGAPSEAAPGTTFVLDNRSEADEVHELLAVRLPDDETRAPGELLALPPAELGGIIDEGLRGFALAFPDDYDGEVPAGDEVTLDEPGRYLFVCLLPTGAPPAEIADSIAEYLARDGQGGPPNHPETGPPHAVNGMLTEVTVG